MSSNTSIVLSDELREFVEHEVASGRYSSASEVLRDGLRLLEQRALQRERLKAAIVEGEQSDLAEPFDLDSFLAEQNGAWARRA